MVLSAIPNIVFPFNSTLDLIFRQSWIQISVIGIPAGGYRVSLIGLLIIIILAISANAITERLTGRKPGGVGFGIVITILGSILTAAYVLLPFDFAIEGVRIIAALLGAVVIATFYTLLRTQASSGGGKR